MTEDDVGEWRRLLYYLQLMILHYRSREEALTLRPALSAAHQDRKRRKEIEDMGKTMAEALIEEGAAQGEVRGEVRGEARGLARGLARGEVCGRRLMLLNQLEAKFGTLPVGVAARVEALTLAELDALGVALIRAESLEGLGLV